MLISVVQQNDSIIHIDTRFYISYIWIFFSIMVYHEVLNIVPWAIQKDLVVYLFYM